MHSLQAQPQLAHDVILSQGHLHNRFPTAAWTTLIIAVQHVRHNGLGQSDLYFMVR